MTTERRIMTFFYAPIADRRGERLGSPAQRVGDTCLSPLVPLERKSSC